MPPPGQSHVSHDASVTRTNGHATASSVRGPRSRENSVGGTETRPENQASSSSATNLPANNDLAQFTSAFPSLMDFENLPEFAPPPAAPDPKRYSGGTSSFDTIQETSEHEEQEHGMPRFPSPPRNAPGSLGVSGIPPRPRSLPEPDTANGTTIGGEPVNGAYFPTSPLEQAGDDRGLVASPVDQGVSTLARDVGKLSTGPPPPKPSFPYAITVSPRRLREYMQNPAVRLLLLDVRSKEDYDRGAIGRAPDPPPAATCDIAWLDPTLLDRTK